MKKTIITTISFLFIFFVSTKAATAQPNQVEVSNQAKEGRVTQILESGQKQMMDQKIEYQILEIEVTKGDKSGETIQVENSAAGYGTTSLQFQKYHPGDLVKIVSQANGEDGVSYFLDGQVKRFGLMTLIGLFIIIVIVVGKFWGLMSLIGLVTSFAVIFKLIIPLIIKGTNPIVAAILGSFIIIPTTFYISHGFNKKTHVGVITTIIGLVLTGWLAIYFVDATHLTGFASEEAGFLQVERQGTIDIKGLLLAGIIIGTLGILDDVTIGQASTVKQLKKANPNLDMWELFTKAMKVGQDHISSMVNTLVLVYSGSALPLLLLFYDSQKNFLEILEFELIAEEIVRMLVGSIGLVMSAPLATLLAAYLFTHKSKKESTIKN